MSYEPTNWKDGDLVTSAKLNKLEQGVANGGGIFIVHVNTQTGALDKTWQEIYDAGFGVITAATDDGLIFYEPITIIDTNHFGIGTRTGGTIADTEWYIAQSADDYPVIENSNNNNDNNDISPAN